MTWIGWLAIIFIAIILTAVGVAAYFGHWGMKMIIRFFRRK